MGVSRGHVLVVKGLWRTERDHGGTNWGIDGCVLLKGGRLKFLGSTCSRLSGQVHAWCMCEHAVSAGPCADHELFMRRVFVESRRAECAVCDSMVDAGWMHGHERVKVRPKCAQQVCDCVRDWLLDM